MRAIETTAPQKATDIIHDWNAYYLFLWRGHSFIFFCVNLRLSPPSCRLLMLSTHATSSFSNHTLSMMLPEKELTSVGEGDKELIELMRVSSRKLSNASRERAAELMRAPPQNVKQSSRKCSLLARRSSSLLPVAE